MRMFRLWCMALCLVFAGASFASAHRVNIFAFVDGDAVQVECGFNRSQKVKQGTVEVLTQRPARGCCREPPMITGCSGSR